MLAAMAVGVVMGRREVGVFVGNGWWAWPRLLLTEGSLVHRRASRVKIERMDVDRGLLLLGGIHQSLHVLKRS
jgi:hypothetical protein